MQHLICVWIQSTMLFCLISGAHCFVEILCIFGVILKLFYGTYCINWGLSKNTCITESFFCPTILSWLREILDKEIATILMLEVESNRTNFELIFNFHQIFGIFFTFWINRIANFQIERISNEFQFDSTSSLLNIKVQNSTIFLFLRFNMKLILVK